MIWQLTAALGSLLCGATLTAVAVVSLATGGPPIHWTKRMTVRTYAVLVAMLVLVFMTAALMQATARSAV